MKQKIIIAILILTTSTTASRAEYTYPTDCTNPMGYTNPTSYTDPTSYMDPGMGDSTDTSTNDAEIQAECQAMLIQLSIDIEKMLADTDTLQESLDVAEMGLSLLTSESNALSDTYANVNETSIGSSDSFDVTQNANTNQVTIENIKTRIAKLKADIKEAKADVEEHRNKGKRAKADLDSLSKISVGTLQGAELKAHLEKIASLKSTMKNAEFAVGNLESRIDTYNKEITNLEKQIQAIKNPQ